MITQERLKELLSWNPESGIFIVLASVKDIDGRPGFVKANRPEKLVDGEVVVELDGTVYLAKSLVWLWEHGQLPDRPLRQINGDKWDYMLDNLEECEGHNG